MKKLHFTDPYLLSPLHHVTINLIGCGGTGSQVLTCLARLHATLVAFGQPGLHVTVFDPDTVSEANIGRQLFSPGDIGRSKAEVLVTRINRYFGLDWEAVPTMFEYKDKNFANILITCTDNVQSRIETGKWFGFEDGQYHDRKLFYWLDFGNAKQTGQVVFGSKEIDQPKSKKFKTVSRLKTISEYADLSKVKDSDSGPSCSLAEALNKQDLYINSTLAQLGMNLLWKLFKDGSLEYCGLYLNLETMRVTPINL